MTLTYVLNKATLTRLKNKNKTVCSSCHKPLLIGQKVVSAGSTSNSGTKVRHETCYEELLI